MFRRFLKLVLVYLETGYFAICGHILVKLCNTDLDIVTHVCHAHLFRIHFFQVGMNQSDKIVLA